LSAALVSNLDEPFCKIILSILTTIFPGEFGLACFVGAKDDGSGGDN